MVFPAGVRRHPTAVCESRNMALTMLPDPHAQASALAHRLGERAVLSDMQMETVVYILAALERAPSHAFFLGDATGVGKGRVIAAVVAELRRLRPETKVLWVSGSSTLSDAALVELQACEVLPRDTRSLSSRADQKRRGSGVCEWLGFTSYGSLQRQLPEWEAWLNGGSNLLVLDEAHHAKNVQSKQSQAVCHLQQQLPHLRVLYATATAAADVDALCYMLRLQLWGSGTQFPSFGTFRAKLRQRGLAAMEMVALQLKSRGLYVCRQLSFGGVTACVVRLPLSSRQRILYDQCVRALAQDAAGGTSQAFAAQRQQFFRKLLAAFKTESMIPRLRSWIQAGLSVVITLEATGEQRAPAAQAPAAEPRSGCGAWLLKHCGVHLEGLPLDPLDQLLLAFGVDEVAEVTGRAQRWVAVGGAPVRWQMQRRPPNANVAECAAFQRGDKHVAIISRAGANGISLHALPGQPPRQHVLLEFPWSAQVLTQHCGRTNRASQADPPAYAVAVTDVPGEQRFAQGMCRSLRKLGALSRGDTATQSTPCDGLLNQAVNMGPEVMRRAFWELTYRHALEWVPACLLHEVHPLTHEELGIPPHWDMLRCQLHVLMRMETQVTRMSTRPAASTLDPGELGLLAALLNTCRRYVPSLSHLHTSWLPPLHHTYCLPVRKRIEALLLCARRPESPLSQLSDELITMVAQKVAEPPKICTRLLLKQLVDMKVLSACSWSPQANELAVLGRLLACELQVQQALVETVERCSDGAESCSQAQQGSSDGSIDIRRYALGDRWRQQEFVVAAHWKPSIDALHLAHYLPHLSPPPPDISLLEITVTYQMAALPHNLLSSPRHLGTFISMAQHQNLYAALEPAHRPCAWDIELWRPGRQQKPTHKLRLSEWRKALQQQVFVAADCCADIWNEQAAHYTNKQRRRAATMSCQVLLTRSHALDYWSHSTEQVIRVSSDYIEPPVVGLVLHHCSMQS